MQVTRYAEVPWTARAAPSPHVRAETASGADAGGAARKPRTLYRLLGAGTPGDLNQFEMVVSEYHAPKEYGRHRHDVDQLRLTLRGLSPWAPGQATPVGSLVYIPAGTYYGPYVRPAGVELFAVQFESASQDPLAAFDALSEAERETGSRGPFAIDPAAFPWRDAGSGARTKGLGSFAGLGTRLALVEIDAGSAHTVSAEGQTTLLFVLAGAGSADGQAIGERDGIKLAAGEEVSLAASTRRLEVFALGLPKGGRSLLTAGARAGGSTAEARA